MKVTEEKIIKQLRSKPIAGGYRLGEANYYTIFNLRHKPNWFHRTMMRFCFGWTWVDN